MEKTETMILRKREEKGFQDKSSQSNAMGLGLGRKCLEEPSVTQERNGRDLDWCLWDWHNRQPCRPPSTDIKWYKCM